MTALRDRVNREQGIGRAGFVRGFVRFKKCCLVLIAFASKYRPIKKANSPERTRRQRNASVNGD